MKRDCVAYLMLAGLSLSLVVVFGLIITWGAAPVAREPNDLILWGELILCVGALIFSIERLISWMRR